MTMPAPLLSLDVDTPLLARNRKEPRVAERTVEERDLCLGISGGYLLADVVRRDTGEQLTVPFPGGAVWPGSDALDDMGLELRALRAVAGTRYYQLTPSGRNVERGVAHLDSLVMVRSHGPSRAAWLLARTGVDLRHNNNEISGLMVNGTRKNYRNRDQHFPEGFGVADERSRNRQIPGPDVQSAFVVLSGAVVIEGEVPIPLTAGMAWPGTHALGPTDSIVQPCNVWMTAGSETGPWLSQHDVECGVALTNAVMLSRLDNRECVRLLGPTMRRWSLESNAGIIGSSADNLRRIMADLQRNEGLNWHSFSVQEG